MRLTMKAVLGVAVLLVTVVVVSASKDALKEVFHWKQMDWEYPDEATRNAAIASGEFIPQNPLPLGLEVWKDKVFITVPRWKGGIPASLNYIKYSEGGNPSPALHPYPDWETHKIHGKEQSSKLISTFRVRADACDRLWVIDTGLADILGKSEHITPPKIMIYDLKTDKLIHEYHLQKEHIKDNSFFANIIVDVTPDKCDHAFAYLPDLGSYAVVVYDLHQNKSFRVKHHYFYMDPLQGDYNVGGVNFQWTDGVFSLALSPVSNETGYRTVYFHPLSSTMEFYVNSSVLQNETLANDKYTEYHVLGSRGPKSQATASFLDEKTGVLFYTQLNKNGIGCWNSYKHPHEYSTETNALVASDPETMIFPNDLKVDRDSNVWLLTDKLPIHIYRKLDFDQINYRIFRGPVEEVVKGTVCEAGNPTDKLDTKPIDKLDSKPVEISTEKSVEQSTEKVVQNVKG